MSHLGVEFNPEGPDRHVSTVERAIRTIKSKVRGIMNILPYNLPARWLIYLMQCVLTKPNCMSMRQSRRQYSSKEIIRDIKFNFKWDCCIEFGEYVQVFELQQVANIMHERPENCTPHMLTGSISGSGRFMF